MITIWQHRWANRLDSDILRADATHTFADVLITSVVIGGWQLSSMGYVWVDRPCAIGVALLVFYLAYNLFRRAVPGVKDVYRIRSRWVGKICVIDLVISVDPTLSTEASHDITDKIESIIEKRFDTSDISIHVEPETGQ